MLGKNAIAKSRPAGSPFLVNSIFPTIQGEGPYAGTPALFVRMATCNLACHFCDTEFETGTEVTPYDLLDQIIKGINPVGIKLVVFTGGEPLLQDIGFIVDQLPFHLVQIETAGTVIPEKFPAQIEKNPPSIVCSPKTPFINNFLLPHISAWKYIIRAGETDPLDGLPIMSTQFENKLARLFRPSKSTHSHKNIFVQACDEGEGNEEKTQANIKATVEIAMTYGYRWSVQLHKLVGLP